MTRHSPTRRLTWLAAAAAGALLTACGGSGGDAAPTTPGASEPAAAQQVDQKLHDSLPADIKEAGKVVIGTEALYPPFESFADDNSTIVGLDPDLAKAAGEILGVEVEFSHTAFDGLLTALDGGRFDLVVAAVTDTLEREQVYDFVDYFLTGQSIVVKKGNPEGIEGIGDLCGKPVAVLKASTQEKLLGQFNAKECAGDPIEIHAFPSDKDALMQVQSGRDVASFTQDAVGAYNSATIGGGNQFEIANSEALLPTPVGMVFTKQDTQLRDAFKAALEELVANGTYEEILANYGLESGAVDSITINGATA
ncbi:atrA protein [Nocardioides gansuensis]|uniref:AtrA protein n=1 Tax=Nocardioides gansuensis TaxID=2138300 RepID=A0A2T8F760_9ACTN|nr:ABC transporter substrate-binding protein [Nocardioides gansuensis]PVG81552.1 atrA protein [Nocardioides gansuensis]